MIYDLESAHEVLFSFISFAAALGSFIHSCFLGNFPPCSYAPARSGDAATKRTTYPNRSTLDIAKAAAIPAEEKILN
jgi:hypothetical protein